MPSSIKPFFTKGFVSQLCPDCDEPLTSDDINLKEGVALCPGCEKLSRLSELNLSGITTAEILAQTPAGCSVDSDGQRVTLKTSLRSFSGFLALGAFGLFWNGIVSVFVSIAIAGLYTNLIGLLPNWWFPPIALNEGKPEMNGGPMDLGMAIGLCLFLVPFVTVGVGIMVAALMNIVGKVEVVVDEFDSYISTGIWLLRWKKRFDAKEVRAIELIQASSNSDGGSSPLIEISADRTVKFGSLLRPDQLRWVRAVLREILLLGVRSQYIAKIPSLTWLSRRATHNESV